MYMGKHISRKIIDCKLVKVEKLFNQGQKQKFYYNLQLEGIDELLLIETNNVIPNGLIGNKIKYKLNEDNIISEFELA